MAESAKKILANAGNLVKQAQELQELEEQNRTKANSEVSSTIIPTQPTLSKDTNAITLSPPLSGTNISSEPANTLVTEAIPVAAAPAKSQDIIAAENAVTAATAALDALKKKIPDPNATPEAAAAAADEIKTAVETLKTATDKLTELNAAAAPIGGRRHSKRRHPKKGSRKSKKGGRSRKSKKGGRSRKNGSKHRKHSRAHKKH
jgi:hypothetical protein